MKNRRYTEKQLIQILLKYQKQTGLVPKRRDLNKIKSLPSDMTFRLAFGSWGKALEAANITPVKFLPTKNGITRKGIRNKTRERIIDNYGYIKVFEPSHPMAMRNGYVREHRKIMFDAGLLIDRAMEVNHINKNKQDNRIENLEVLTKSEHAKLSTPLGIKRPRKYSVKCKKCNTLQNSKYGLCQVHYKSEWYKKIALTKLRRWLSGQKRQTVNLLSKGYAGSNPALLTNLIKQMEILPSQMQLHHKFIKARDELQQWIDTHAMPSRYFIASEKNFREKEEYEGLMKKFKKAEDDLLKYYSENLSVKDISKLNEISS